MGWKRKLREVAGCNLHGFQSDNLEGEPCRLEFQAHSVLPIRTGIFHVAQTREVRGGVRFALTTKYVHSPES